MTCASRFRVQLHSLWERRGLRIVSGKNGECVTPQRPDGAEMTLIERENPGCPRARCDYSDRCVRQSDLQILVALDECNRLGHVIGAKWHKIVSSCRHLMEERGLRFDANPCH